MGEYKRLSPTPNEFPDFVKRVIAMDLKPYDFGADKVKAIKAPILIIPMVNEFLDAKPLRVGNVLTRDRAHER